MIESRSNLPFMKHIILYECQGSTPELEIMSREFGRSCMKAEKELLTCNSIVAAWSRGSEVSVERVFLCRGGGKTNHVSPDEWFETMSHFLLRVAEEITYSEFQITRKCARTV